MKENKTKKTLKFYYRYEENKLFDAENFKTTFIKNMFVSKNIVFTHNNKYYLITHINYVIFNNSYTVCFNAKEM